MTTNSFVNAIRSLAAPLRVLGLLLLLLSFSRAVLVTWYWGRVAPTDGVWFIFLQGVRFDLVLMGMLLGPALLAAPWLSGRKFGEFLMRCYLVAATFFIVWIELGTIPYIDQYDARPNYIYVEYLKYPREVFSMLLTSYGPMLALIALVTLVSGLFAWRLSGRQIQNQPVNRLPGAALLMPFIAIAIFAMIRSTLDHHPVNPSTAAFTTDSMVNQLPLNSPYTLIYAVYEQNRDRKGGAAKYGKMQDSEVLRIVAESAGLLDQVDLHSDAPSLHLQTATRRLDRPQNLVIILEESMGAEFVGSLGGEDLTPNLDALADEGIWFEQLYATGTRSVRGIEAIVSGFPPTIRRSTVKLAETQNNFFTLASLLQQQNYQTSFIYGGSAHFDNMRRFFLNNGFQTVIDQDDFEAPQFVSTWGVSDEDLFLKAHEYFIGKGDQPFFSLVFSSSNHKPFEVPAGKVETRTGPDGPRHTAVAYADYALGRFLELARSADYYANTVFLVVSDHNSRVKGAHLVPIERFHVPGVIIGGSIKPRRISGISSQLDLLPTLLSLMGVDSRHPAIGRDLTTPAFFNGGGRAQMQFHDIQAWMVPGRVVILQRKTPMQSFLYEPGGRLVPDPGPDETLQKEALAHALWPSLVIKKKAYQP
jgi:phosphoglycerol transferase MdoB-like AlkP superfamily enzyme